MQNNPFFVAPGNDMSGALSGLSSTLANVRQGRMYEAEQQRALDKEAAATARMQEAQAASQAAFQSGDPTEVARVSLQFPEVREGLTSAIGLVDEAKQKEAGDFAKRLLLANPAERSAIYQERIAALSEQGRDPSHTMQSFKNYSSNPNGELQALESTWAAIAPKEYMVLSDQKKAEQLAAQQQRKEMREDQKMQMDYGFKSANLRLRQLESEDKRDEKALAAESNDLKRQQLQLSIDEKKQKMDMERAAVASSVSDASSTIDSAINTADQLLTHPGLSGAVGTSSVIPNIPGSDASDFEQTLASFNAKTFLSSVSQMKGLGALTEAEGAKLVSAAGALSPKMSETEFKKSLQTIRDGMEKAKGRLASKIPKGMQQPATQAQPKSQGPQVGEVADGYTFMGGDPADPENWSQQ